MASEASSTKKEPPKRSKVSITVDTSPSDVLRLDSEGYQLLFSAEPGSLPDLTEDQTRELSYDNRVSYGIAMALSKEAEKRKDQPKPLVDSIKAPLAASAGRRLEVIGAPEGWHYCWKRPDELHEAGLAGYTYAGDEVQTYATRVGSTHRVSALGQDELILMKIPQEQFEKIEREAGERSRQLIDSGSNAAKENIARLGGKPFEPSEKDGRSWNEDDRREEMSGQS